ncbi:plasmid replication protein RepC [Amaricoccus solimangrovi]|uniref:Uncharacterized protein n=1 Tax=Amaricoccus solimangrovi TaxID=2589815 RepID=A0A501WFY8_9RHOB|nr:hypothetical protein FJM51_20935 [Amaricoccus solimangrovi]
MVDGNNMEQPRSAIVAPRAKCPEGDAGWWPLFRALKGIREQFGLGPQHLNTLAALLSFLRPGSGTVVFASNRSIIERLNGVSERTLQRHIHRLAEAGLLCRADSPNRKRYRVTCAHDEVAFGLCLSPLLAHADEILKRAEQAQEDLRRCRLLRQRLLALLARLREVGAPCPEEPRIRLLLRRRLAAAQLEELLDGLSADTSPALPIPDAHVTTDNVSASDTQNVVHYQKSEYRHSKNDSPRRTPASPHVDELVEPSNFLRKMTRACPDALVWLGECPRDWRSIGYKAREIAGWIGISPASYDAAAGVLGPERTAATLLCVLQSGPTIRRPAAYFHSITRGPRSQDFSIEAWLMRLAKRVGGAAG